MIINRQHYIQQLENKSWNGKVKIITGIRRCGKSYLLSVLYKQYLMAQPNVEVKKSVAGKQQQSQYEIDFVVNTGREKVYIQSALNVDTPEKRTQETFSLRHTSDSFRKMVILDGSSRYRVDEDGVAYIGVIPFLLQAEILEKL